MPSYFRPEGVLYESVDGLLSLLCLWEVLVIPVFTAIEFAVYLPLLFPVVIAVGISTAWLVYLLTSRRVKYMYFEKHDEEWE